MSSPVGLIMIESSFADPNPDLIILNMLVGSGFEISRPDPRIRI